MARPQRRLRASWIAGIKKKGMYCDGNGLYLRVTEAGTKSWIYRYCADGKTHDMGLGSTASISLKSARKEAIACTKLRYWDIDPLTFWDIDVAREGLKKHILLYQEKYGRFK